MGMSLAMKLSKNESEKQEMNVLFYIAEALKRGISFETIHEWSQIDLFFLYKMEGIIKFEKELANIPFDHEWAIKAKKKGFSDIALAELMEFIQKKKFMIGV